MMQLFIPVILGTAREGRRSENAARFVLEEVKKRAEVESELMDARDFRLPVTDNSEESDTAKRFEKIVSRADGFIIVSPEYNHGYPGELKMMLDMLYEQYARKPVAICGVSSGGMGGVRMVEQLRLVAIEFHMVPIQTAVYFSNIGKLFDGNGVITDLSYSQRVQKLLDELIWYGQALKAARANGNE